MSLESKREKNEVYRLDILDTLRVKQQESSVQNLPTPEGRIIREQIKGWSGINYEKEDEKVINRMGTY